MFHCHHDRLSEAVMVAGATYFNLLRSPYGSGVAMSVRLIAPPQLQDGPLLSRRFAVRSSAGLGRSELAKPRRVAESAWFER